MPILASPTPDPLPPTHGPAVADWMERELVHGEGDREGEPFRLAGHLLRALYRWYEYDPATGFYRHYKGLIGWPKGSAKTEFEQAVALEHLEGPSATFGTPVVTIAAVDGDQAAELVYRAGMMIPEDSPLRDRLEVTNGRILQRRGAGRINAVSSALGKNDGKLTSLLLNDELHEWDGVGTQGGAKRHATLERNTNKRANGRQLNVTTAGWSLESLAGAMYQYGCKVAAGEVVDPQFMFEWWQATDGLDLDDPAQLRAAIIEANPLTREVPHLVDRLVRGYLEHQLRGEVADFRRYHLNQWVGQLDEAWMDMASWYARAVKRPLPHAGVDVVLGFDGSYTGDSTALVGATVERKPHLFVVDCWEQTPDDRDWRVPVTTVEARIEQACSHWNVRELIADVSYWQSSMARLLDRGVPVVEAPQTPARMGPACQRLYEATTRDMVSHAGDARLDRHISNARRLETEHGVRIVKEHSRSKRFIDLAIAAVLAHDRAAHLAFEASTDITESVW